MIPYINSVPKSGTNLLQKTLELLGYQFGNVALADSLILGKHYLARQIIRGSLFESNPISLGLALNISLSSRWLERKLRAIENTNKYITGHSNYSGRFRHYLNKYDVRMIHVLRDPRDVIVSWAHYVEKRKDMKFQTSFYSGKCFEDRVEMLLSGGFDESKKLYFDSFSDILRKVEPWIEDEDVCVVRFEDLIGTAGGGDSLIQRETIKMIVNHLDLGSKIDDARIDQVANDLFGGTHTFRKGQIGSWKKELNTELQDILSSELSDYIEKWGYS